MVYTHFFVNDTQVLNKRKTRAFCMEEAKYLPTTALSFFIIPQNLYVTTLDGKVFKRVWGGGGGGQGPYKKTKLSCIRFLVKRESVREGKSFYRLISSP